MKKSIGPAYSCVFILFLFGIAPAQAAYLQYFYTGDLDAIDGSDSGMLNIENTVINVGDAYEISFVAQDIQELEAGVKYPLYGYVMSIGDYGFEPTDEQNMPCSMTGSSSFFAIVCFLETLEVTISPLESLGTSLTMTFSNVGGPVATASGSGDSSTAPADNPLPVPSAIWLFASGLALLSSGLKIKRRQTFCFTIRRANLEY